MASRILGMGDVLTLIEKAEAEIDEEKAKEMSKKLKKAQFDFEDYLESMQQMKKMGAWQHHEHDARPWRHGSHGRHGQERDQRRADRPGGAEHGPDGSHDLLHDHRGAQEPGSSEPVQKAPDRQRRRVDISEVNRMVKQFAEMKKMMKMLGKGGKRRKFGMPF